MKTCVCALMAVTLLGGFVSTVDAMTDKVTISIVEDRNAGHAPIDYEAAIKEYFHTTLKEPTSAQYGEITKPSLS